MKQARVEIKIADKLLDITYSWNDLIICRGRRQRRRLIRSVCEQLSENEEYKNNLDFKILSTHPKKYRESKAEFIKNEILRDAISEMERRYELIGKSWSRNYLHYNEVSSSEGMKLIVLIIDGIDKIAKQRNAEPVLNKLFILSQKSRCSGIHVLAFVDKVPNRRKEFFRYLEITNV